MALPVVSRLEGMRLHRFVILHLRCSMRIEEGKHYVTRGGEVYGPILPVPASWGQDPMWQVTVRHKDLRLWTREGQYTPGKAHPNDLVKEAPPRAPTRFRCVKDGDEQRANSIEKLVEKVGGIEGEFSAYFESTWWPIEVKQELSWSLK
jgi:hypothetical protein